MGATSSVWLRCARPKPDALLRLVCMPCASGDAAAYWPWLDLLGHEVERGVRVVDMPHRGYGSVLTVGFAVAELMADADDSYALVNFGGFMESLHAGGKD